LARFIGIALIHTPVDNARSGIKAQPGTARRLVGGGFPGSELAPEFRFGFDHHHGVGKPVPATAHPKASGRKQRSQAAGSDESQVMAVMAAAGGAFDAGDEPVRDSRPDMVRRSEIDHQEAAAGPQHPPQFIEHPGG